MQLIVLGMHRSGTSVLARLLNLMGAYFGPEGVSTGANQENPKGFWERRDVRALNDAVLHAVGCDWDRVLRFDAGALPQAVVADFDKRASKLILEMDAHRPWLLKEPRLCLLMPLWRKWLEAPVCISIYRNPVEVASSLHRRNGIPIEAGMMLWERYVRSALQGAAGLPEVVVSHRALMRQPGEAAEALFKQLEEKGVAGLRMPAAREVEAFVQDNLYRERESREDLRAYAKARQLRLFKTLEAGGRPSAGTAKQGKDEEALAKYEAGLPPIKTRAEEKMPETIEATLRGQLALREQEIQFVRELSGRFETDAKQYQERLAGVEREHSLARESAAKLEANLALRQEQLANTENETRTLRETVSGLEAVLHERDLRLSGLQRDLDSARATLLSLEAEVQRRSERMQGEGHRLEQAKQTIAELEHKHALARQALDDGQRRLESASEAAREAAAAFEADIGRRALELAEAEKRLASSKAETQALREQRDGIQSTLSARDAELASARDELARKTEESKLENEARRRVEANLEARYQELTKLTQWLLRREQEFAELNESHRRLEMKQWAATHESAELKRQLEAIRRSRAWRLAAPLRMAERALGGARGQAGELKLLQQSGLFDESWYLQAYPDVARSGMAAAEHFLQFGVAEGRDPGPDFSTVHYLKKYPDVADAGINPLLHYITHGKLEGRSSK
ncbi:hypothetical protein [Luteimonas aquatica]|uniref:hypothetical protein n=1 Tax=Luteimonas aquatica TaxID=450364 RepID=UPI001F5606B7|nr:hypothetical protein [Luteimonas aquatica]